MSVKIKSVPSVSVTYARNGASTKANALGMRPMQERPMRSVENNIFSSSRRPPLVRVVL
jgi:hypothetical protein